MKFFPTFFILLLLTACGSPFDEDYWDDDLSIREQEQGIGVFSVNLQPLSALSFSNGDAIIDFRGNAASLRIEMQEVPQNIVQAQVLISEMACENIVSEPPTTGSLETRNYTYIENGTRAALFNDPSIGETAEGRSLVVYAMVKGTTTTLPSGIFPLACGPIVRPEDAGGGTTATAGGVAGGVTGGVAAGTAGNVGGVTAGVVGGVTGGVVGGITAGVVGGIDSGVAAGGVAGGVAGGTGSVVGGVAAGTAGGTAGVGGVAGGTVPPGGLAGGTSGTGGVGGIVGGAAGVGGVAGGTVPPGGVAAGTAAGTTGATIGTTFGGADGN